MNFKETWVKLFQNLPWDFFHTHLFALVCKRRRVEQRLLSLLLGQANISKRKGGGKSKEAFLLPADFFALFLSSPFFVYPC